MKGIAGQYWELTKPRVVALIVFTALVGMFLAVPGLPPLRETVFGLLGIWLSAASAAAINHLIDQRIDKVMARTANRPLATGTLKPAQVLAFAVFLGAASMTILIALVNPLTAALTFASLIGYAIIYTGFLKRATPQNIVIGGIAGAAPPLLGWAAVTNMQGPWDWAHAWLLVLIVFVWTPPHFWALAIFRRADYARALVPMLPVTHGVKYTRYLKRATPQNIVIGGLAGAIPPVLGWTAVTGELHAFALQLCLIIFVWTPPHFWALAIFRRDDYARAGVPMLPVTHGVAYTRWQVFFYTVLLVLVTLLPAITGMSGLIYLGGAIVLDLGFLYYAIRLLNPPDELFPMKVFKYSVVYLMALFAFLLLDHWLVDPLMQHGLSWHRVP